MYKRPFLNQFLEELKKLQDNDIIEVATYTAATQDYADDVLNNIDPSGCIRYRFYRHDCQFDSKNSHFVKDLRLVQREIKRLATIEGESSESL